MSNPVAVAATAAWVLVSSFPQGELYRAEREGSEVVALRAEGRLKAPAWAVREVLASGWKYDGISPYLAERKVLFGKECLGGARDLPVAILAEGRTVGGGRVVDAAALGAAFADARARSADTLVLFQADEGVPHGRVVQVMELARQAGLSRLAIATRAEAGGAGR